MADSKRIDDILCRFDLLENRRKTLVLAYLCGYLGDEKLKVIEQQLTEQEEFQKRYEK